MKAREKSIKKRMGSNAYMALAALRSFGAVSGVYGKETATPDNRTDYGAGGEHSGLIVR